ncbi:hypothetical protein ABPG74_017038 [Tetrahymena malaccensis]
MSFELNLKCQKHKNKNIELIQVNEVLDQLESKQIFYCSKCVLDEDNDFKIGNFIDIDEFLNGDETEFIKRWPPLNDKGLIQKLKVICQDQFPLKYINKVNEYFLNLKKEIIDQLNVIQKQVIDQINIYPTSRQIINEYQNISEIKNLRNLFKSFSSQDFQKNQAQYKDFIINMECKKDQNTEALNSLKYKSLILENNIDFQFPNFCKEQIQFLINQINFFKNPIDREGLLMRQQPEKGINPVSKIMDLVSNKSNFCSFNFLNQFEKDLQKFSLLFNKDTFQNIHSQYKINFNLINEEDLNKIKQYVNHKAKLNQLSPDIRYTDNMQQRDTMKQILQSINNSNLKKGDIQKTQQIMIETAPFYDIQNQSQKQKLKNLIQSSIIDREANLFSRSELDLSSLRLSDFSPLKINYVQIFEKAMKIIQEKEYLDSEIFENMNNIPQCISECFTNTDSEQNIAQKILNLYTQDTIQCPIYKFLNNTLFSLNTQLIQILKPFYLIFSISLFIYCDQDVTQISNNKPLSLYRGVCIKNEDFNNIIKEKANILLPGFSSFSSEKRTAQIFTKFSKFSDTKPVIFKCPYQANVRNQEYRPKNISKVSQFKENEYIFYPFSQFQILSLKQKEDYCVVKIRYLNNIYF